MAAKKAKIKFSPFENVRYDVENDYEHDDQDEKANNDRHKHQHPRI
jgi:hypothetical protein